MENSLFRAQVYISLSRMLAYSTNCLCSWTICCADWSPQNCISACMFHDCWFKSNRSATTILKFSWLGSGPSCQLWNYSCPYARHVIPSPRHQDKLSAIIALFCCIARQSFVHDRFTPDCQKVDVGWYFAARTCDHSSPLVVFAIFQIFFITIVRFMVCRSRSPNPPSLFEHVSVCHLTKQIDFLFALPQKNWMHLDWILSSIALWIKVVLIWYSTTASSTDLIRVILPAGDRRRAFHDCNLSSIFSSNGLKAVCLDTFTGQPRYFSFSVANCAPKVRMVLLTWAKGVFFENQSFDFSGETFCPESVQNCCSISPQLALHFPSEVSRRHTWDW